MFGLIGAYFVAASPGGTFAEGISQTLQYLVSPWMLATEAISAGLLVYGFLFVRSSPWKARDATTIESLLWRQRLRLILVAGVLTVGLIGIGAFFARSLEQDDHQQALVQTQTIARLKAQQVDRWLYERSIDVELAGASLRQLPLDQWSSNGEVRQIVGVLLSEIIAGHHERIAVTLFAPDGRLLINRGQETTISDATSRAMEAGARKSGLRIIDTDQKGSAAQKPGMSFVLPISKTGTDTPMAILDITVDPAVELLGQVQAWPTSSASGEILIVRREGHDVVYITTPRLLDPGRAGDRALRIPITTKQLPAAEAILHGEGAHNGPDYRGIEVVAASARVQGIAWYIIAKIDHDEVAAAVRRKIVTLALVIAGAILLTGLMTTLLWHGQRASMLAYRASQDVERAALIRHYDAMFSESNDIVILLDANDGIVEANPSALRAYGYSPEETRRMHAWDLRAPETKSAFREQWQSALDKKQPSYQTFHRRKDGTTFPVEISGNVFEIDGVEYRQAFIHDISVRQSLERTVARIARAQRALFEATSVLFKAGSEDELYKGICNIIVGVGGYCLADVAVPNHDEGKTVRFLAIAGRGEDYLADAKISWDAGPRSIGPTGTAIRDGVIQVNQDFKTNPRMAAWRDAAAKHGLQSSVSLPLRISGQVFGALTVYSEYTDAFNAEELNMLVRFAEYISYGLEALRRGRDPASS